MRVEAERARLQELIAQGHRLQKSLVSIEEERQEAAIFTQQSAALRGEHFRALSSFMVGWEGRKSAITRAIDQHERQIDQQKGRLLRSEQDERCLSKLRERRFGEWKDQVEREIEATAQELWLFSHTTNREDPKSR